MVFFFLIEKRALIFLPFFLQGALAVGRGGWHFLIIFIFAVSLLSVRIIALVLHELI